MKIALPTGYDSQAEYLFHQRHPELILCNNSDYPYIFKDDTGRNFGSKPDFWDTENNCWIEYKCAPLNVKPNKTKAEESHDAQVKNRGYDCTKYQLDHAWNHSLFKQVKVQSSLEAVGKKMIVVFDTKTNWDKNPQRKFNKMNKNSLIWHMEDDYFNESTLH